MAICKLDIPFQALVYQILLKSIFNGIYGNNCILVVLFGTGRQMDSNILGILSLLQFLIRFFFLNNFSQMQVFCISQVFNHLEQNYHQYFLIIFPNFALLYII